jgi:hypothetical protein
MIDTSFDDLQKHVAWRIGTPMYWKAKLRGKKGYRLKIGTFGFQLMITEEIIDK